MNKSHTENHAKFTGTLSLTLPAKFVRVGLQNNHFKLYQRYIFHRKADSFTWRRKSLWTGKAQNNGQTHNRIIRGNKIPTICYFQFVIL